MLGEYSFRYRSLAVHGFGISASSNFAVLSAASQLFLKGGPAFSLDDVAKRALEFDRSQTGNLCVAADDVYPIVYGGVVTVHTTLASGQGNGVAVRPVPYCPDWISKHIVLAFNRDGERHDVKGLLDSLFRHPDAKTFVKDISEQATAAAAAISCQNIQRLAKCVNKYRRIFHKWTKKRFINPTVRQVITELKTRYTKENILAWKPPGAGASEALAILTPDRVSRDIVLDYFEHKRGWWSSPAYVSMGLCAETITADNHARFTAGHRFDLVGGADLGQAPEIDEDGVCCSFAIEPRSELVLEGVGRVPR